MSTEIREYLETETVQLNRSFKIGLIAMIIISLIIILYFQWILKKTEEILAPANLAEMTMNEVRRNLPDARIALEANLMEAAPEVVNFVMQTVVDKTLPMVREAAGALFQDYSRELAGFGTLAASQIFEQIVQRNKVELAKAKDTAEPAFYAPNRIAEALSADLDRELGKRINDVPEETTGMKLKESVTALHNINRRLQAMAVDRKLSRKDELGKKLITTWWTFLNSSDGPDSAQDKMMDSTLKPITHGGSPEVIGE